MLRERILTALVLLALLIPAVAAGNLLWFELLTALMIGAGGWEWGRLCGLGQGVSVASGVALALACGVIGPAYGLEMPAELWGVVAVVWVAGGALALRGGPDGFRRVPAGLHASWIPRG